MNVVMCFDLGSSSIRVAAFELKGASNPPSYLPSTLSAAPCVFNYSGEADPITFLDALENCITSSLEKLPELAVVKAVSITSFAMSWLGVTPDGDPATPVFTYARAHPDATRAVEDLRREIGAGVLRRLYVETGTPIHGSYAPSLLLQLLKSHRDAPGSEITSLVLKLRMILA